MTKLQFNGFATTSEPLAEGDVALVIRANNTVEAVVKKASEDGRDVSTGYDRILMVYALMLLLNQEALMEASMKQAAGSPRRPSSKP